MIAECKVCICTVQCKRLVTFVNHCLACCKELFPCSRRSSDTAVIKDIFVVEDTAYLRLLCNAGKESCPACSYVIKAFEALCIIAWCCCHIGQIIAEIFVNLSNSGVVIFKDVDLFARLQCCLDDCVDITAFPFNIDGCACLLWESFCCFFNYDCLRLSGTPHRPECQFYAAVICCTVCCRSFFLCCRRLLCGSFFFGRCFLCRSFCCRRFLSGCRCFCLSASCK